VPRSAFVSDLCAILSARVVPSCRWAGPTTKAGLIGMCFMGAFGFVIEDSMQECRMREGYKRVGADE
jgi:hypothetical protein